MSDSIFPDVIVDYHLNGDGEASRTNDGGLTKRELFAAMAMQGLLSNSRTFPTPNDIEIKDMAASSVDCADALIRKLEQAGGDNDKT